MAYCTVNGEPVFQAQISFPRIGSWHATVAIASNLIPPPGGAVTLAFGDGDITWQGTVYRGGAPYDTAMARIVGGSGGIATGTVMTPVAYQSTPLLIPLMDILNLAGERLCPKSDPTVLNQVLNNWTRLAEPAGFSLSALLRVVGASWRFYPDGTLWVGKETWPLNNNHYTVLSDTASIGTQALFHRAPDLQPGQSLATNVNGVVSTRLVSYVQHKFKEDSQHTEVIYEDGTPGYQDRYKGPLQAFIRATQPTLYDRVWAGTFISQRSDGNAVDFVPDSTVLPGMQDVPIRWGEPGVAVQLTLPCRGLVSFDNGDPQKPSALAFDTGQGFASFNIGGGTNGAARVADLVAANTTMAMWITQVSGYINGLAPGTVTPPTDFGKISTGSAKVKIG